METIKQLRQRGYKVRVLHTRKTEPFQTIDGTYHRIVNSGGHTKIEVTTPDMATTVIGEAKCSDKDSFNRRIGNRVALGRALEKLNQ
jgi:hypothetical protein